MCLGGCMVCSWCWVDVGDVVIVADESGCWGLGIWGAMCCSCGGKEELVRMMVADCMWTWWHGGGSAVGGHWEGVDAVHSLGQLTMLQQVKQR